MRTTARLVAAAAALALATSAHALVVFDPTNYSQTLLTASRSLEQVNNQIKSLQNEAQSLLNQAKNLASLDYSALGALEKSLSKTNALIAKAQGLSFEVETMEHRFEQLYPEHSVESVSQDQMLEDARQRWIEARSAFETTMRMQAEVSSNLTADEGILSELVDRSQSATGILQATQATNQLLALQARQAIDASRLKLAQDRAVASEQARALAEEERAREMRRRFHGNGSSYQPAPVRMFPE